MSVGSRAVHENMIEFFNVNSIAAEMLGSIEYDGQLSAAAYNILTVVLLGIIVGLCWCFYRAITAPEEPVETQHHDEIGD